jgi:hypothetical protein
VNTFKVRRAWRHEGYEGGREESLILVNGQKIGGVYYAGGNPAQEVGWGHDDGGKRGPGWISWGPRGLSCGHRSRAAAERAQVREYAANPDLFDRLFAQERAEHEAKLAEQDERRERERILRVLARDHTVMA